MTAVTLLSYPFLAADCAEVVTYNGEEVKRQFVAKSFACHSLLARLGTRTPLKLMNDVANVGYGAMQTDHSVWWPGARGAMHYA